MTALLVTLTLIEIAVVLGVVVGYLIKIAASLRRTAVLLGKVSFGVRAIESQCAPIGPSVLAINDRLATVNDALSELAALADAAVSSSSTDRRP